MTVTYNVPIQVEIGYADVQKYALEESSLEEALCRSLEDVSKKNSERYQIKLR